MKGLLRSLDLAAWPLGVRVQEASMGGLFH